jgi:hypothetical protein
MDKQTLEQAVGLALIVGGLGAVALVAILLVVLTVALR